MKDRGDDRRNGEDDDTKFPTGQMITLAICKFSEPIAFNSVIAYTFPMTIWLHNGDERNASFYAGLLVSAYAFGEVLTAVLWGSISDRIGRKPIVLSGLVGVALSCVMFGLAQKYWVALLARLIGGALNGNVAVMQTMLAEMVKRPEHEPTAYAIHPFVWSAGGIIGSAMGGYLAKPADFYPGTFSRDGIFGTYPFLLPNIVSVVAILIAVIQGSIFLIETNPHFKLRPKVASLGSDDTVTDERTPLRRADSKTPSIVIEDDTEGESPMHHSSTLLFEEEGLPGTTDPYFDIRRTSFGTMHSIKIKKPLAPEEPPKKPNLRTTFNSSVVMLIISLTLMSYHSMAYGNMIPIFFQDKPASSPPALDLKGGLGYNVHDVGSFMAVNGFIALFVQGVIFPVIIGKLGVWKSFLSFTILYPFSYTLVPFLTMVPEGAWRVAGIYGIMVLQNHLGIVIPPCALILIKNATPSPLVLSIVNGATMSIICAARTAAPPVAGIIYGAGGSAACWFSLSAVAVVAVIQLIWVPREQNNIDKVDVDPVGFKAGAMDGNDELRRTLSREEAA